jgi:hypothetical protein
MTAVEYTFRLDYRNVSRGVMIGEKDSSPNP